VHPADDGSNGCSQHVDNEERRIWSPTYVARLRYRRASGKPDNKVVAAFAADWLSVRPRYLASRTEFYHSIPRGLPNVFAAEPVIAVAALTGSCGLLDGS